jgi:hypothetical protein
MATSTPWGASQYSNKIVRGIMEYGTAGHGGVHVSPTKNALIPEYMRSADGWYEEDCDWCIPAIIFKDEYIRVRGEGIYDIAVKTLRNWHPEAYEKFFNVELAKGESYINDERLFKEENKNNWVVISASGKPEGVHAMASRGGRRSTAYASVETKTFLVPDNEYSNRGKFGFVIDPKRHPEI